VTHQATLPQLAHWQLPLAPIAIAAAPGHASVQVEPPPQLTEHVPVQVMWQVDPPEQSTLALWPTVMSHVECPVHLRLHDWPHAPAQSLPLPQSSEQLLPQLPVVTSQVWLAGQLHDAPLQVGGLPPLLPHEVKVANSAKVMRKARLRNFMFRIVTQILADPRDRRRTAPRPA
jgi:hypothetical protein